jgi:hypothetical protein
MVIYVSLLPSLFERAPFGDDLFAIFWNYSAIGEHSTGELFLIEL